MLKYHYKLIWRYCKQRSLIIIIVLTSYKIIHSTFLGIISDGFSITFMDRPLYTTVRNWYILSSAWSNFIATLLESLDPPRTSVLFLPFEDSVDDNYGVDLVSSLGNVEKSRWPSNTMVEGLPWQSYYMARKTLNWKSAFGNGIMSWFRANWSNPQSLRWGCCEPCMVKSSCCIQRIIWWWNL